MKHNIKITIILLLMFIVAQFIGLYVINHYASPNNPLPYGLGTSAPEKQSDYYTSLLPSLLIAFVFAILLFVLLTKFKAPFVLRAWFLLVVIIALGVTINSFLPKGNYVTLFALIVALPLALIKVIRRNLVVHNLTELLIYPGIASIFVPILNFVTIIILLVLISIYDMWAVWRSGIMQKMVKYQIKHVGVLGGFLIPYISKKERLKLDKIPKAKRKDAKVKAQVAMLGGGDVVFPIITAGVMFLSFGILPAILTIAGAILGLSYLFFFGKKKAYPAMPFITSGIFMGMLVSFALHLLN